MKNSGVTFVHEMRKILGGLNKIVSYINNLIVHTHNWKTYFQVLKELFQRLQQGNFTARPSQCVFESESVQFLRHHIGYDWITIKGNN